MKEFPTWINELWEAVNELDGTSTQPMSTIAAGEDIASQGSATPIATTPREPGAVVVDITTRLTEDRLQAHNAVLSGELHDGGLNRARPLAIGNFIYSRFDCRSSSFQIEPKYYHRRSNFEISKDALIHLIQLLKKHHYDGRLHREPLYFNFDGKIVPDKNKNFFTSMSRLLKRHFHPPVIAFQIVNLLEITAILTAIWELKPDYRPDWKIFSALGVLGLAVLRNSYYFVGATVDLSRNQINALHEIVINHQKLLYSELQTFMGTDSSTPAFCLDLLSEITMPTWTERVIQEFSSWSGAVIKLGTTMAVFLVLGLPLPIALILGVMGGLVQGIDGCYKNNAIAMVSRGLREYLNGVIPPLKPPRPLDQEYSLRLDEENPAICTAAYAILFPIVADLELLVRGVMPKIAPVVWAGILFDAVRQFFAIANLPAQYVVYGIGLISSLLYANVFVNFNLNRLGSELPTQRTLWGYEKKDDRLLTHCRQDPNLTRCERACQLIPGALPAAFIAGIIAHQCFKLNLITSGCIVALPVELVTTSLLAFSPRFANGYSQLFEFQLVNSTLAELDGLHIADKMALIMLSVVLLAVGISHHHSVMTGMSGTALFLFLTTCLHRNRAFANGIRYLTAPTLLNAVALFTWILNFLLPMLNIAKGRAANDDHQTRLTEKYFDHTRYDFVLIFALLLGMGAAYMTWRATGNQVTSLIAPVNPRESSFIAAFLKFLSRCCLPSGGYQSNTRDSSSFLPLVKRCFFKAFHYCCYGAGGPKEEEERLLMIPS